VGHKQAFLHTESMIDAVAYIQLYAVRLMFKSTVQEDDLNSMFGSLTTRPASAKSTSTATAEK
jgi:hypothetical protein